MEQMWRIAGVFHDITSRWRVIISYFWANYVCSEKNIFFYIPIKWIFHMVKILSENIGKFVSIKSGQFDVLVRLSATKIE